MPTSIASIDLIARCKAGAGCATDRPFFSAEELDSHDLPSPEACDTRAVTRMLDELQLPESLHDIYTHFANPNIEVYIGVVTFMCLNSINSFRADCLQHGQDRIIDFAFYYRGMGHITMYAYDPVRKGIFTRPDGGSNGWDRAYNAEQKYKMNVDDVEQMSVNHFLQHVNDMGLLPCGAMCH